MLSELKGMLAEQADLRTKLRSELTATGEHALGAEGREALTALEREVKTFGSELKSPEELTKNAPHWKELFGEESGLLAAQILYAFHKDGRDIKNQTELILFKALIKAIARGRAWFEELASGRARSLHELAKRDGISRRYIRRLVNLAFLSPKLIEAMLQGRQPVELTATRLTELDLPLDWSEQHRLLAS